MTFGQRIKTYRQQKGLSQEKVAQLVGVSRQAVGKWEADQSAPSTENLLKLAEILGCTVEALLSEEEQTVSPADELFQLLKEEEAQKAAAKKAAAPAQPFQGPAGGSGIPGPLPSGARSVVRGRR